MRMWSQQTSVRMKHRTKQAKVLLRSSERRVEKEMQDDDLSKHKQSSNTGQSLSGFLDTQKPPQVELIAESDMGADDAITYGNFSRQVVRA